MQASTPRRQPHVESDEIAVSVRDGVATLRNTADSFAEQRIAIDNAYEGRRLSVRDELIQAR
jgi:osmotically-inducible protein OsmY